MDDAARRALDLYSPEPLGVRAHVAVRWRSCPFPAVAEVIPKAGRILEVGCGHGLFSAYLALQSAERHVAGIDIDERKIKAARRAATRAPDTARLAFELAAPGQLPNGPYDAIAVVDVMYLLDRDEQEELVTALAARLAPGGVLAIKEMDVQPRWKVFWNRAQEQLAVKVLRITAGRQITFVAPGVLAGWMADAGLRTELRPLHKGSLHPHHLVVGRR